MNHKISKELASRILVLDGAMGTALQSRNLSALDFGGEALEGCNEFLVHTRPEIIRAIHEEYLEAGCDIIETNTFGGTPLVLGEYDLSSRARELNLKAARLAREAADRFSSPTQPRFVAGSLGPTTKAISVTGGITFDELIDNFEQQAAALIEGHVDYLLLETCQDTRNIKAGVLGIERAFQGLGKRLPIAVSGTIEATGTMLGGQTVEALVTSLSHLNLLYLGLNCATGPEFMTDPIRSLHQLSPFPVACVPNAGLPDENGHYLETPGMVARILARFIESGWINLVGGCCGTHAGHIRALAELCKTAKPRQAVPSPRAALSGIDYLEITQEMRPVIVGERTNVIGSKKFKTLITEEKFDEASEIARAQIKGGAQIIDICLANPDRDEAADMKRFLEFAMKKVRVPVMIDSTDSEVIELALTYCQGKAIINSINLEDGEERFEAVVPLARRYGAALVVGTIDDDPQAGMGVTRERKLEIAQRSYQLLTQKYGVPPEDIYWDPLVFPCATGDEQYLGSAVETIEGIRLIKEAFPQTKSVLGISNISFGLPAAGREVLNSVFLYHCVQAGLDLAIVNSEKLERYASIPEEERRLAENLLFSTKTEKRSEDPVAEFAAHFRNRVVQVKAARETIPLETRLSQAILEGSKDGLVEDLNEALQKFKPLEIINGPLMQGMDEVGRLFNQNQLIVAEVLQSAEVMKTAVAHLEPLMEKNTSALRGKMLLATVKGDVHDIGKNLVDIIFTNNGFDVINLGIKVAPEQLIAAVREHQPDLVGLSGLLVKSAHQMVTTAEDFARAGIRAPLLVGGAALTESFVDRQISQAYGEGFVAYAGDAMSGLEVAKTLVNQENRKQYMAATQERRAALKAVQSPKGQREALQTPGVRSSLIEILKPADLPTPPDFDLHILRNTPIETIWRYINPLMLYGRHLGIRGGTVRQLESAAQAGTLAQLEKSEPSAVDVYRKVQEVMQEYKATEAMAPSALYRFFRAGSLGDTLYLANPSGVSTSTLSSAHGTNKSAQDGTKGSEVIALPLPRQNKKEGLCLTDYLRPVLPSQLTQPESLEDSMAIFVVSVGKGVRELAEQLKQRGDYLKSHILSALALESAEAYAEYLHSTLRSQWGFADPMDMKMMERFQAKYRGKRYSFGYPACPRLDDQALIWRLLEPNRLGIQLTDGFMMEPESSVSALVFHHPQATYYSVGGAGGDNVDQR
jgi:5-methyltetrahydrofolate--homocysteine methyltransferase